MRTIALIALLCASACANPARVKRQTTDHGICASGFQCVPYWQCDGDGNIVTDGTGIIDIRLGPDSENDVVELVGGNCPNILDVCCKKPNSNIEVTTPPPHQPKCGSTLGKKHGLDLDLDVRIHLNTSLHSFDNVAQFGAYPWMAAILLYEKQFDNQGVELPEHLNIYQCGGSLIHPQVVLTAAHCVKDIPVNSIKVRLGEWDTQSLTDHPNLKHQDRFAADVKIHERYWAKNVFNDVALIFLSEPATLDYHIDTICMPELDYDYDFTTCYATGWGKDNYGVGNWQAILKEIDLPVVDRDSCLISLRNSRLGCYFCLHDTFMCAGGEVGKDTCEGDGGSPLVCYDARKHAYVQAGIVAWGIGCGTELPGVYVDVRRYKQWIQEGVNSYFFGQPPYFNDNFGPEPYKYEGDNQFQSCIRRKSGVPYSQYPPIHNCYKPAP